VLRDDADVLKALLRREEQLRFSDAWQSRFAAVEDRLDADWLDLVELLQEQVVREAMCCAARCDACASAEAQRRGLLALRTAADRFPHDADMRAISVYRRHNHARRGTLRAGDALPDCALVDAADGSATTLHAWHARYVHEGQPLLIIAGSWT
jgi:hypothetical protein